MNIWTAIETLIDLVEIGTDSPDQDVSCLVYLLDFIALKMHSIQPCGGYDSIDIPQNDYQAIRKAAEERFPNWGYYNTPQDVTEKAAESALVVGDAIDDITDIVNDLKIVMWSYRNETETHALWLLQDSYLAHWRAHMRHLQLYLHCLESEVSLRG